MDSKLFVFDVTKSGDVPIVYFVIFVGDTPGRGYTTAALVPITDDGGEFSAVVKPTAGVEAAAETLLRAAHGGRSGRWMPWKADPEWVEMYERWMQWMENG